MLLALLLWQGGPAPLAALPSEDEPVVASALVAARSVALPFRGVPEEAAMMIVGAALIGLASALRRTA